MPRLALAPIALLALALLPAAAAADSAPPDRFGPCEGRQQDDPCCRSWLADGCEGAGCTCRTVDAGCPGAAASCLACESDAAWCGPSSYVPDSGGCASGAPAGAAALGLVGLALLARRRPAR